MIRFFLIIVSFFLCFSSSAQDSTSKLSLDDFLWYVRNYHPVSKQGKYIVQSGKFEIRKARGAFDPYIYGSYQQKNYDQKNYYQLLDGGLKVPTWFGVELKTGYEQNRGLYLNNENTVPNNGLWYAGISLPVGKGLFIDERRASLKQAKIFAESTQAQQQQMLNELFFQAIQQYWEWVKYWNIYKIQGNAETLANERFEAIKIAHFQGDLPAIDTLEAYIQLQNRNIAKSDALVNYKTATQKLSNYLWFENNTPLEVTDSIKPPEYANIETTVQINLDSIENTLVSLELTHPEIQQYQYKLNSMDIDRRMNIEALKPTVDVFYNPLNEPNGIDIISGFSPSNFKWGLDVGFPIFLRTERGKLQLTKLKIQQIEQQKLEKTLNVQNKLMEYYYKLKGYEEQLKILSDAVKNYNRMLEGERIKFDIGESSIFLINNRENKLIDAQIKYVELLGKLKVANSGIFYAQGILN